MNGSLAVLGKESICLPKAEDPTEFNPMYLSNEIIIIMRVEFAGMARLGVG